MRKPPHLLALAMIVGSSLLLAACGGGGGSDSTRLGEPAASADADRTIEVTADDPFTFSPDTIEVSVGETILFRVTNEGQSLHEFVLGPDDQEHQHGEDGDMAVHLDPGQTKELAWTFTEAGSVDFACYIPGHTEAGMTGTITVTS